MRFTWILSIIGVLAVGVGLFVFPFDQGLDDASTSNTSIDDIYLPNPRSISPKSLINIPTANSNSAAVLSNKGDGFSRFRAHREANEDVDDPIYASPQPDTDATDKNTNFDAQKSSVDESVSYLKSLVDSVDEAGLAEQNSDISTRDFDLTEKTTDDSETGQPLVAIKKIPPPSPPTPKNPPKKKISSSKSSTKINKKPTPKVSTIASTSRAPERKKTVTKKNNTTKKTTIEKTKKLTPQKKSKTIKQQKTKPQKPALISDKIALIKPKISSPSEPQFPQKKAESKIRYSVAVIINGENFDNLTRRDIKNIYTDKVNTWKNGKTILVFNLPIDTKERKIFSDTILDMTALEAATSESNRSITNSARNSYQTKRDRLVTSYVARHANAIGYVPFDYVKDDERVRIIYKIR